MYDFAFYIDDFFFFCLDINTATFSSSKTLPVGVGGTVGAGVIVIIGVVFTLFAIRYAFF